MGRSDVRGRKVKETDLQSFIVKTVEERGGAAVKLSNRFLVGVPDLLVKLPDRDRSPCLIEVKLQQIGATTPPTFAFIPDLTKKQDDFLRRFRNAGMHTFLLSFVERGRGGVRAVSVALFKLDDVVQSCYRRGDKVIVERHVLLGKDREETLWWILTNC